MYFLNDSSHCKLFLNMHLMRWLIIEQYAPLLDEFVRPAVEHDGGAIDFLALLWVLERIRGGRSQNVY